MKLLYNLSIRFYWIAIKLASFGNPKAKAWIEGRKNWHLKLSNQIDKNNDWIWVHCASVGEYEDCAELIAGMKTNMPSCKILLTFFSPSGMNEVVDKGVVDLIMFIPFDTKENAKRFLNTVEPMFILFSRSELWYNLLIEIKKRIVPVYLISILLTQESKFLKWPQCKLYKRCFEVFTKIYCQNHTTKKLLNDNFKIETTMVIGNSRIDRIYNAMNETEYKGISDFVGDSFCVISGSCLDIDEKMILFAIDQFKDLNIKWIIVPHEINENRILYTINKNESSYIAFSNISQRTENHNVLYIDFVGGLKHLYRYANVAIIGGGFNKIGIHNIIEPTFYGVPTAFGPNHRGYQEAIELLDLGYSTIYRNQFELQAIIQHYYGSPPDPEIKRCIKDYGFRKLGATKKIITDILVREPD